MWLFYVLLIASSLGLGEAFNGSAKAYDIVWESITSVCEKDYGIKVDVAKYGMSVNKKSSRDGYERDGNVITIFYGGHIGTWPVINPDGSLNNGGVPQAGNITLHYEGVTRAINELIPDVNFSGLAVFDMEAWCPIWEMTTNPLYLNFSITNVQKLHPKWPKAQVEATAKKEFEAGARIFMEGTLKLAQKLRPFGGWGYYEYPRDYVANMTIAEGDDRMLWLFEESDVLYPCIYFMRELPHFNLKYWLTVINATTIETQRIRKLLHRPGKPVYPYITYTPQDVPYFKGVIGDLIDTIGHYADSGFNGVVIWREGDACNSAKTCEDTQKYVDTVLGPYAQTVMNGAKKCSDAQCSGHGRCALVNPSLSKLFGDNRSKNKNSKITPLYECYCYDHWVGEHCETPLNV